jgi:hypothetical protein
MTRPRIHLATLLIVMILAAAALGGNVVRRDVNNGFDWGRFDSQTPPHLCRGFPFMYELEFTDPGDHYYIFEVVALAANVVTCVLLITLCAGVIEFLYRRRTVNPTPPADTPS